MFPLRTSRILLVIVSLSAGGLARPAWSGPADLEELDQRAAARALFNEGLAFADHQEWEQAADRFDRARALRPSPEISYNLSTSLMRLSKLVRASELLRQIVEDPAASASVKSASRARLSELVPRLAYLTIKMPRGRGIQPKLIAGTTGGNDALVVLVDGNPFDEARLDVAVPMDPTAHTIHLRLGTSVLERRELLLDEGERRTISFESGAAAPLSARPWDAEHVLAGAPNLQTQADSQRRNTWVWVLLGAAVAVGLTATTVVALQEGPAPVRGNVDTWTVGN